MSLLATQLVSEIRRKRIVSGGTGPLPIDDCCVTLAGGLGDAAIAWTSFGFNSGEAREPRPEELPDVQAASAAVRPNPGLAP